ncbi:MAG: hypothetical protein IID13_07905 [Candidatus Marinimicrobia bacterium]|nr:hypothetical protein [Candidatus Neomarinimicrobiota bacterium]
MLPASGAVVPFSRMELILELGAITNRSGLLSFWQAEAVPTFIVDLPFYRGQVQAGWQMTTFRKVEDQVPNFNAHFIFTGWGMSRPLPGGLSISGGIQIGSVLMIFQGVSSYARHESELGTALYAALSYRPRQDWTARIRWLRQRIHTRIPIYLTYVSVGLGYNFKTPKWLRDFLQ